MGKDKVLQFRITDSSDPKIIEWANAQTLSSSEIIKFFIEFDIALNGGVRDIAEVITTKRTKGFMQSYINALIHRSNNEQVEVIYDRDAGTVARRVPAPANQSTVFSSNNTEVVQEEKPVINSQLQEKVANSSQPSIQEEVQTPSVQELQAQIEQMQAMLKENQAKQAPVEEKITDSVTRTPAPKVDKKEQVQSSNTNSDDNVDVKSAEAEKDKKPKEPKGNDLSALKKSFNVKEWMN
ncbi:hypothetical protein [Priestia megaterium]|uniref:Uncharacterized protein n=1 Tax=Priestia megaterium TaxID=1404 RepID=A0A6M6E4L1_PRIMG|nr:hypothetical protein [Priestia megaterium]QJX80109.1 hypothetical protein FDZ14_28855 [Priestia megaterium]